MTPLLATHTPGPWKYAPVKGDDLKFYVFAEENADAWIADVFYGYGMPADPPPQETVEASARLIAASPRLLAALQNLVAAAASRENTMGDPCDLIEAKECLQAAIADARAAMAEAKGRAR